MRLTLDVWRQDGPDDAGRFERHDIDDATPEMTLLELLDRLNDQLVSEGRNPVVFDHDCREGICVDVCPAGIPLTAIATLNREVMRARLRIGRRRP